MRQRARSIRALCTGAIAAVAFLALSVKGLDRQGMYYDEVHQAPAAFFYIGENPGMFTYPVFGVPVLNMGYSGAIKSTLYGLYLRFKGGHFTVYSWRLLGLLFVAAGLFVFYRTAGLWLPAWSSILFGALFLTDTSVILMSRHDWGPVALSLGLRLVFVGLWISLEWKPTRAGCFLSGLIMGIALFEKLSAVVLLLPFVILLWSVRARLSRALRAASLGFGLGVLPLVLVNLASYKRGTGLISLADVKSFKTIHLHDALNYAREYLVLGQGAGVRGLVLGDYVSFSAGAEVILMLILLLVVIAGLWRQPQDTWGRLSGGFAASYILVATALFLMPQETSVHHWILGTPFQYAAVAAALAGFSETMKSKLPRWQRVSRILLLVSVAGLTGVRLPNIVAVEKDLAAGKASKQFDPDFTRVAELAAARSGDAVFVSADWGTATQIYCVNNGRADLVYETFWGSDPGNAVLEVMKKTAKPTVYILVTGIAPEFAAASAAILQAAAQAPGWREAPVEREFADLHQIKVRRFARRT